jgi:hypothetical protein
VGCTVNTKGKMQENQIAETSTDAVQRENKRKQGNNISPYRHPLHKDKNCCEQTVAVYQGLTLVAIVM